MTDRRPDDASPLRGGGGTATYLDLVETRGSGGLPVLLQVLRYQWTAILLVVVPLMAGAIWYAESLPSQFTTESVLVVQPRVVEGSLGDPSMIRFKAPTYVAFMSAPTTQQRVADEVGLTAREVESGLEVTLASETGNITVGATHTDPVTAQAIVDATVAEALAFTAEDDVLEATLVAPAAVPTRPSGPARRLIEAAALLVAGVLGFAVALMRYQSKPRVHNAQDVSAVSGWLILGRVPKVRGFGDNPLAAFSTPALSTAIRTLRVHMEGHIHSNSVLTVTSPLEGEGKTTVSTLVAVAMARIGVRTLLIDGDVLKPRLTSVVSENGVGKSGPGLLALVRGEATPAQVIRSGFVENLDVITTERDREASDLLSRKLGRVLADLRGSYDLVIIDAPPLGGTDESRTFAVASDGVMVVTSNGTPVEAIAEATATLSSLRVRVIGAVVNRVSGTGAYGYGYGTYGT